MKLKRFDLGTVKDIALELVYPYHCRLERAFKHGIHTTWTWEEGPVCDGGNHGCTMKGIVAVDAAFRSADLALEGIAIEHIHGINAKTPELTMRNK